jgi:spore maturation protein CgeB
LSGFDVVLSYTGGRALQELSSLLGARAVAALYGWVDAETHFPTVAMEEFRSALSYLGTFSEDRQTALDELFVKTASELPAERFAIGGVQYPENFPWKENIYFVRHLPPELHRAFYCSSRATLNVTRQAMAQYGFCPSGRLFEAAACGTPILSDRWEGLDTFFHFGTEILPVNDTADVLAALSLTDAELKRISAAARARALECHSATQRVLELETICDQVRGNALHC